MTVMTVKQRIVVVLPIDMYIKARCVTPEFPSSSPAAILSQTLYARALYDNTAKTEDELAFRKGDIIMVLEKNVAGSNGWWTCSLHGRQGLAPANRLAPLSPTEAEKLCVNLSAQRDFLSNHSHQNIYQTPNATNPSGNPIYEYMNTIYKVPHQANRSPDKHTAQEDTGGTRSPHKALTAHPRTGTEIYDVPRKPTFFIMVGQRLVNTLCNEAKSREANRDMMSMSTQLCAYLKQLAMVTKKAAVNFPDKLAVQEAEDIAKELSQRVQHFRMSLDV